MEMVAVAEENARMDSSGSGDDGSGRGLRRHSGGLGLGPGRLARHYNQHGGSARNHLADYAQPNSSISGSPTRGGTRNRSRVGASHPTSSARSSHALARVCRCTP